jgi:uncharacterized damage-inducible protein DinB
MDLRRLGTPGVSSIGSGRMDTSELSGPGDDARSIEVIHRALGLGRTSRSRSDESIASSERESMAPQNQIPAENYAQPMTGDARPPLPDVGGEREILTAFLDWHRQTFEMKCAGVPTERLSEKNVPPSGLSLHGLVRHLAAVERWWFRQQFAGEDVANLYYTDDDPNQDFDALGGDPADAFSVWREECRHARQIVAATPSLDQTGIRRSNGEPISLRRILVHMIAEYARHNGHADLIRERIDGLTGY